MILTEFCTPMPTAIDARSRKDYRIMLHKPSRCKHHQHPTSNIFVSYAIIQHTHVRRHTHSLRRERREMPTSSLTSIENNGSSFTKLKTKNPIYLSSVITNCTLRVDFNAAHSNASRTRLNGNVLVMYFSIFNDGIPTLSSLS